MITAPQEGTREYYEIRETPKNPEKMELLKRLQRKIYTRIAETLPVEHRPSDEELRDIEKLRKNYIFMDYYFSHGDKNHPIERVFENISNKRGSPLMGAIEDDNVFFFLKDLVGAISHNPGFLDGKTYDERTKGMGKEWASNFIEGWIFSFQSRTYLDGEHNDDKTDRDEERRKWNMEKKYNLLVQISRLSDRDKNKIISGICRELPSYPGAEFSWDTIQELYDDIWA